MRHLTLVSFYDQPTGELGLAVKGNKGDSIFAANEASLIAHDILEHQNGIDAIGCQADELEAMGGLWQVRGRHGDLMMGRQWRCPAETIGTGDIVTIATDWMGAEERKWYPRLHRYRTRAHDYDDDFQAILEHARPNIVVSMRDYECEDFPLEAFLENALHLMRRGFNKAKRRFGMGWEGYETFRAITNAINPHMKWVEREGQEFRLSYGNCEARCVEIEQREEW